MDRHTNKLLLAFFLFLVVVSLTHSTEDHRKVENSEDVPGHPGWFEQWKEMKTLGKGAVFYQRISNIRHQQRQQFRRSIGNLTDVKEIGPFNVGGRTRALVIDHSNTDHLIAGGVSGGLWQSFDRGASWDPVDDFGANLSVSYITQSPFDADIFYYSSGEPAGNSAGIPGNGVYKSTDGGATFFQLSATANSQFDYTWRVEHSLVDSNTVFVATERAGLFRSVNGGDSFSNVFNFGNRAVTDMEVFADSSILIGVEAHGVFYSATGDSGTFVKRDSGLPAGSFGRVELAYPDSFPNVVYATFANNSNDGITNVYKSTDHGITWTEGKNPMEEDISLRFPWYCLTLEAKPDNPQYIVIGGVEMAYSANSGKTWIATDYSHADHHIVRFDPEDPDIFYDGNDGGLYRYHTSDAKFEREDLNNGYNVTQFYTGAFFPERTDFYGGTQDNGTQSTKNGEQQFEHIYGGDGSYTQINQQFPSIAFVSWQNGHIYRTYNALQREPGFHEIMNELDEDDDGDIDEGSWFIHPFEINRQSGFQLFFPTRQRVWRTVDGGDSWQKLTQAVSFNGSPFSVGVSNEEYPTIYFGGTNSIFYRVDSAATRQKMGQTDLSGSVPDSVKGDFIGNITVSPNWDSVVYISLTNYSDDPRIYKVVDAKSSQPKWIDIHNNLPHGLPVNWIEVSPLTDSVIMAATDFGLYTSVDAGTTWHLETDIPNVSIHQIRLRHSDGKLFIFTHGRGAFTAQIPGNFTITGVKPPAPKLASMEVYPNPATDYLHIRWPGTGDQMEMQLFDMNGRLLQQKLLSKNEKVDLTSLKNGMYVLQLNGSGPTYTSRIVKH